MKQEIEATPAGANEAATIPLTMEGVTARVRAFNGNSPNLRCQGMKSRLIDSALAKAGYDEEEATLLNAIKKQDSNAAHATDPAYQAKLALNKELEACRASRKLRMIFDGLLHAQEDFERVDGPAKAAESQLGAAKEKAAAMESKLADYVARNAPIPRGQMISLKDIQQELDTIHEYERNQLSEEERNEVSELNCQLPEIKKAIEQETPNVEKMLDSASAAKEQFNELIEVAAIAAESVIKVYQISCEAAAPCCPC